MHHRLRDLWTIVIVGPLWDLLQLLLQVRYESSIFGLPQAWYLASNISMYLIVSLLMIVTSKRNPCFFFLSLSACIITWWINKRQNTKYPPHMLQWIKTTRIIQEPKKTSRGGAQLKSISLLESLQMCALPVASTVERSLPSHILLWWSFTDRWFWLYSFHKCSVIAVPAHLKLKNIFLCTFCLI